MGLNVVETLVDSLLQSGKLVGKLFLDLIGIEEQFDIERFFKTVNFKNKKEEYPKQIKIYESKRGYIYLVSAPVGLGVSDFGKHKESLELQLRNKVEIKERKGYIEIEVITKRLSDNIPYNLPGRFKSEGIVLPIGKSLTDTIELDLKENPHSYIVGTTGSGKSVCTKGILTSLTNLYYPSELELYLCDLKRVELNLFSRLKHTKKFVYTVEDTTEVIADLLEETNKRYDLFMKNNVTSIFEYNKLPGVKKLKYQILYVEEIVLLLEDKNKKAMKLLKQLIAISRASGCYVFITTQRPSADVIDSVVKANINNRIVFKCEDSKNSMVALDKEGAEKLKGRGHGFIKRGSEIIEFQSFNISDEQVKELIKKYKFNKRTISEYPRKKNIVALEDLSFLDNI
ncbi:FtsK/SpoIIIE domain-containing protein [Paeniclostridium hominis]|uniref:FtsK/SpoIIIE domain-containing protein n=1 Tax=Paeniclostridium hominis TaxID=2764329 RepID=UPI0022E55A01|nr:FtsK/SpoIIIE domain-containing protein [Paeniclostridium hominis]